MENQEKDRVPENCTEQPNSNLPQPESIEAESAEENFDGAALPAETQPAAHSYSEGKKHRVKTNRVKVLSVQDSKLTKKQRIIKHIMRWVLIVVGAIMMASSVYFFQAPNNFTLGGIAGIAIILESFLMPLASWLTYDVIMAILNVLLLILGLIILGKQCTLRTIVCSLIYIGATLVLGKVLPLEHPITYNPETGTSEPFMELCYAILLFGVGGALIFNCGASSGGTDIIALIFKKYTKLNVGLALMLVDFVVLCISFFTFQNVSTALFSFLGLFAKSFLLDGVIDGMSRTKYITIITTHHDLIAPIILNDINHGFTMYEAQGGYTGEGKKVLTTVCKRNEAIKLKTLVKKADPSAFVIITNSNEIVGKGFDAEV